MITFVPLNRVYKLNTKNKKKCLLPYCKSYIHTNNILILRWNMIWTFSEIHSATAFCFCFITRYNKNHIRNEMNMLHNARFVSLWEVNQDCRRVISYYSLKWNKTSRSLSCIVNQYINLSVTAFKAREENLCMLVQGETLAGHSCSTEEYKTILSISIY